LIDRNRDYFLAANDVALCIPILSNLIKEWSTFLNLLMFTTVIHKTTITKYGIKSKRLMIR